MSRTLGPRGDNIRGFAMRWFVGAYAILVAATSVLWSVVGSNPFVPGLAIGLPGLGIVVAWLVTFAECPNSVYRLVRVLLLVATILSTAVYLLLLWKALPGSSKLEIDGLSVLFLFLIHGPQYLLALLCIFAAVGATWVGEDPPAT